MKFPIVIVIRAAPGDARSWIGLGSYALVLVVLGMMWADKTLLNNDFFKVIATALILNSWVQGPVGWAYQATKGGGEAAESSARIAETVTGVSTRPKPDAPPQEVIVANPPDAPANVREQS